MPRQPNILLFFTDQQRHDTIAALGNPHIRTPVLDRLCREGTAFTSAYTPSPVCVAARCSLLLGRYPVRTRCYDNGFGYPADEPGFVARLAAAGYRTHAVGKCHFPEGQWGYSSRVSQEELPARDKDDYLRWLDAEGYGHVIDPMGARGEMYYIPQISQLPASHHPTAWVGQRSIEFLRRQRRAKKPWFLFSSFIHPHPPFAPPSPWHKLYRAPLMPLPKEPADQEALWSWVNRSQNRYKYRDQGRDGNLLRNIIAHYYGCISFIDFQIGRVLSELEGSGQLDDTLILFSSDHGELLGDYGCYGKRSFHDSAARIPLLARYPRAFAAGGRCAAPASLVDIASTALTAAGADASAGDGVDLTALADGRVAREAVHIQYQALGRALCSAVTSRFKYTWSAADGREWLMDRVADPAETRSVSGSVFRAAELKAMRQLALDHQREAGVQDLLDGDGWRRWPKWEANPDPDANLLIQDPVGFRLDLPGYWP